MNLYRLSAEYQAAFLAMADSELDEITIDDTIEGMEGELIEKARNVLAYSLNRKAEAKALREGPLAAIQARIKRAESEAAWMEDYLKKNMAATGITEIEALDHTFRAKLFIGRDESVEIDDANVISHTLCRHVPESWVPDKSAIKAAIKSGVGVDGAHIVKKDRLEIK